MTLANEAQQKGEGCGCDGVLLCACLVLMQALAIFSAWNSQTLCLHAPKVNWTLSCMVLEYTASAMPGSNSLGLRGPSSRTEAVPITSFLSGIAYTRTA